MRPPTASSTFPLWLVRSLLSWMPLSRPHCGQSLWCRAWPQCVRGACIQIPRQRASAITSPPEHDHYNALVAAMAPSSVRLFDGFGRIWMSPPDRELRTETLWCCVAACQRCHSCPNARFRCTRDLALPMPSACVRRCIDGYLLPSRAYRPRLLHACLRPARRLIEGRRRRHYEHPSPGRERVRQHGNQRAEREQAERRKSRLYG